jgi:hypothetical protein
MILGIENKPINIKDISLDLSKRYNKYFDHRSHLKFINKDQTEVLLSEKTGHVLNDLRNRFALKILYPESSQPSFTDEELELNIDRIKSQANTSYLLGVARRTALSVMIDPTVKDKLPNLDRINLKQGIKDRIEKGHWSIVLENVACLNMIDQGEFSSSLNYEETESVIDYFKSWHKGNMMGYIEMLADARIGYPKRDDIWSPDKKMWQMINNYFKYFPKIKDRAQYFRDLANMAIITADNIFFSEGGIGLSFPENIFSGNTNKIPERRRF